MISFLERKTPGFDEQATTLANAPPPLPSREVRIRAQRDVCFILAARRIQVATIAATREALTMRRRPEALFQSATGQRERGRVVVAIPQTSNMVLLH